MSLCLSQDDCLTDAEKSVLGMTDIYSIMHRKYYSVFGKHSRNMTNPKQRRKKNVTELPTRVGVKSHQKEEVSEINVDNMKDLED